MSSVFRVSLIIAWAFEMTPQGLKRDDDIAPNEYIPRWSTRKFAALIVSIAMLAAGVPMFHTCAQQTNAPGPDYCRFNALSKVDRSSAAA